MEINEHDFIEIFKTNFNYEVIDTPIGRGVKMNAYNAFIYSSVTGAGYLDNHLYLYTPKGLLKVFYNAFDYNFVTGIFDHSSLTNTPLYMNQSKPYLFNGDKIIIPVEFDKELELQELLFQKIKYLNDNNIETTNFIIQRIEKRKRGNGLEPLMEYLATEVFKNKGYIVETQIPLTHNTGSPDFGGYILENINNNDIANVNFQRGFHVIELSLLRLFKKHNSSTHFLKSKYNKAIVGEAKTSTSNMTQQLEKYLETSLFDEGYEIHPLKLKPNKNIFGLLTLNKKYEICLTDPIVSYTNITTASTLDRDKYFIWLDNYMKYYIFANLNNDELNKIFQLKTGYSISSDKDVIQLINDYSIDEALKLVNSLDNI